MDDRLLPDSPISREAVELSSVSSHAFYRHHNLHAYFWGRVLDDAASHYLDEAVFVATMLHDLGLTDGHRLHGTKDDCFCVV